MSISYNPAKVTFASGLFSATLGGAVQGMFEDDPAVRNELASGFVDAAQTTSLYGGMAITEKTPNTTVLSNSGQSTLTLATAETNITGFTVFNQSAALFINPSVQSSAPIASGGDGTNPGGAINFFRLGSGARIWVACSSAVAAAFSGVAVDTACYWDYTNQVLLSAPGGTALPVLVVGVSKGGTAMVVTSPTNFTWNYAGYAALIRI